MALPVIENVFRCTLNWSTADGVTPRNVFHVRSTAPATELEIADAINTSTTVEMWNLVGAGYHVDSVTVLALDGSSAGDEKLLAAGNNGGGAGDPIPSACAVLTQRTAQRGPRGRGRLYLGPMAEGDAGSGLIPGTKLTACVEAWIEFNENLVNDATTPCVMVVASYTHADAHNVTNFSMNPIQGTQRRRQNQLR